MADICICSKRTVISTRAVEPGKFHSLSSLDHTMEKNALRIVFYYRFAGDVQVQLVETLKVSLSVTLSSFPLITGRLQRNPDGKWRIKCNDAGVRMVEAKAEMSMEEWLQKVDRTRELQLIYWEDMFSRPYYWSTFFVQLTEFEGGGLAIGLGCSHLLADAASATMLIKSWADTNLTGKLLFQPKIEHSIPNKRPFTRNPSLILKTHLVNHYKSSMAITNPNSTMSYATVTFCFTDEMVKNLIITASAAGGSTPTPFEALAAIFWVGVSRVKGKREGLMDMSICLDMRNMLGLGKDFFGNAMVFGRVCGEKIREGGIASAARALGEEVKKMGDEEELMNLIEWLDLNMEECKDESERVTHHSPLLYGNQLLCANWDRLSPYTAIFEKGIEPARVSYYVEPIIGEGQIIILPSKAREGLARMVMVTLPQDQSIKLCEEASILWFYRTIVL